MLTCPNVIIEKKARGNGWMIEPQPGEVVTALEHRLTARSIGTPSLEHLLVTACS